jgi:hypothetical protein
MIKNTKSQAPNSRVLGVRFRVSGVRRREKNAET